MNKFYNNIMERCFIFSALLLLSISIKAQTDTAQLKISYETKYKIDANDANIKKDCQDLLIGKRFSKFYSIVSEEYKHYMDSVIDATNGDNDQVMSASKRLHLSPYFGQNYKILKNYPNEGTLVYIDRIIKNFKYQESMPDFQWSLEDGDTIVATYKCQKANCRFRGEEWNVWYTTEIPINDGPWKFSGLPGLILKAVSRDGNFSFECIGIHKGNGEIIELEKDKYTNITPKELQDIERLSVTDIIGFMKRINGISFDSNSIKKIDTPTKKVVPIFIEYF